MTREEQILNNAINYSEIEDNFMGYYDCGDVCDDKDFIEKACIESAKWADKTMIDKACEWISIYYPNIDRMGIDNFITVFRKAMEE